MKVLVTGSAGLPGRDVLRLLENRGIPCRGVDAPDFDPADSDSVSAVVEEYVPDVIVHCAAYTNVDKAESEPATCAGVNGFGALTMARAAARIGAKMLLLSTAQVFSGAGDAPNAVSDPYGPRNVYGMSMVQAEDAVRSLLTRYYIVRTGGIFGNSKDPVRAVFRAAQDGRELEAPECGVEVSFHYTPEAEKAGKPLYAVFRNEDGSLVAVRAVFDPVTGKLRFLTKRLGRFMILGFDFEGEEFSPDFYAELAGLPELAALS